MITKDMLAKKKYVPYNAGIYEFEIVNCEYVSVNGNERLKLFLKFIGGPLDGKPLTTSIFFGALLGDLITIGLGKTIGQVFGSSEAIEPEKIVNAIKGGFFKGRLGIKNDYNNITEILKTEDTPV